MRRSLAPRLLRFVFGVRFFVVQCLDLTVRDVELLRPVGRACRMLCLVWTVELCINT